MAITTIDGLVAAAKQLRCFYKASATAEGAGTWHSQWLLAGQPGAGATPPAFTAGSGYQCTRTTQGALPFTNPVSGNSYLMGFAGAGGTAGMLILYDRLWTCSGFVTNSVAAQNITTPGTIPARDSGGAANGDDVELWLEVYTAPGATGATWTVSYTNEAGTAGRSATYTHPANAETVGQMMPMRLQAGDKGVRAVASLTCSISSGTAGNIGITLMRRLAVLPTPVINVGCERDWGALGLPRIYDDSCLAFLNQCSTTASGIWTGQVSIAQG